VTSTDSSHNPVSRTDWRKLGELKLQAGSNPDGTIKTWLTHILSNFSLSDDLANRLLKSMEDAAVRVLIFDGAEVQLGYLEIVVLAPADLASQGQTWGFFRVERTSPDSNNENPKGHCIDYYLYLDRNSGEHKHAPELSFC
jgi:hypothetical protein